MSLKKRTKQRRRRQQKPDVGRKGIKKRRKALSLCSPPNVIYAIIAEYGTHNLNRAQLCFIP